MAAAVAAAGRPLRPDGGYERGRWETDEMTVAVWLLANEKISKARRLEGT